MALKHIQLISSKIESGVSKKDGKPFAFLSLQGLLQYDDGSCEVFTYDFWPKKGEACPDWQPGIYLPVIEPRANWQTRKLEARIVELRHADPVPVRKAA